MVKIDYEYCRENLAHRHSGHEGAAPKHKARMKAGDHDVCSMGYVHSDSLTAHVAVGNLTGIAVLLDKVCQQNWLCIYSLI